MTDVELIEKARAGDGSAIQLLYNRHAARVYSLVRRFADRDDAAEDWAQEAWIRVFKALPTFRGEARFTTWLHRVAVNSALQGRRRQERRRRHETPLPPVLSAGPDRGRPVLRLRLERAIQTLPPGMRRVLVLHDVEGYTHEEIGELLGIAPGTSKSQLFKARARMREILAPARESVTGEEEVCHT